jgi:hypothetical protein
MNRKLILERTVSFAFLVILCGGCAGKVDGTWKTDPEPKNQRSYLSKATFMKDKTFSAVARDGALILRLKGTYEYHGVHLRLKSPGWPDRIYTVSYRMIDKTLELSSDAGKIAMKRQ